MQRDTGILPTIAIFVAGIAAGVVANRRRPAPTDTKTAELENAVRALEARLDTAAAVSRDRFAQIETRLDEQAAKLAEVPSTSQIVAAMEQLLTKTMASLDERLTTQAHSIDVLKTTVGQTDNLLERVLESLDSLQNYNDAGDLAQDPLLHRPAV